MILGYNYSSAFFFHKKTEREVKFSQDVQLVNEEAGMGTQESWLQNLCV